MKNLILTLLLLLGLVSAQAQTLSNSTKFSAIDNNEYWLATLADIVTFVNAGSGTVTSVGLSLPSELSVTGSPVTTSGTLSATWANQTTNKVFASPNGSTGTPTFRALVAADIPTIPASSVTGANLTAASSKIAITGGTGAVLTAATVDVTESNLTLNNIGGTLGIAKGGTNLNAVGGDGTILASDGSAALYLSPTITTSAAAIAFARSGSNLNLNLPNADASNRGTVSTTTQTFAGGKTFSAQVTASSGVNATATSTTPALFATGPAGSNWTAITTTTTLDETYNLVEVGTLSAGITVNLPSCNATRNGWEYHFFKSGNDAFATTIDPNGSETFFDSATTKVFYSQGNEFGCKCRWNGSTGTWFALSK